MRSCLIGLVCLAACYQPALPAGAPCTTDADCPIGQTCTHGACGGTSGGMPDAAPGVMDRDHDGIADDKDNCPDTGNPEQANEDGDKFGDLCDPCPQIADNVGLDSDGDHIGDACDPNQGLRDTVWLYEGFHAGLPSLWSHSDHWAVVGDAVQATAAGNTTDDGEYLTTPFKGSALDNFSVTMTVQASPTSGSMHDHSVGITVWDRMAGKGIDCALDQGDAGADSILYLGDEFTNGLDMGASFSWSASTPYRLTLTRHGPKYSCSVTGLAQPLSGNSAVVPRDTFAVEVWAYGATARYDSVQILGTP